MRKWTLIVLQLISCFSAVYSEISAFLHLYSMLGVGFDNYNLTMIELECIILIASTAVYMLSEALIDKVDFIEQEGIKIWELLKTSITK